MTDAEAITLLADLGDASDAEKALVIEAFDGVGGKELTTALAIRLVMTTANSG